MHRMLEHWARSVRSRRALHQSRVSGIAFALLLGAATLASDASAEDGAAAAGGPDAGRVAHPFEIEKARLQREIGELKELEKRAAGLVALADVDPKAAFAARSELATCLKTPLKPYCQVLSGLFKAEVPE